MKKYYKEKFNIEKYPKTFCYVLENDTFEIRCNSCNSIVLQNPENDKPYQCMFCDEDLTSEYVHSGSFHSDEELNELCNRTLEILCLDD